MGYNLVNRGDHSGVSGHFLNTEDEIYQRLKDYKFDTNYKWYELPFL